MNRSISFLGLLLSSLALATANGQEPQRVDVAPHAPPTPPPIQTRPLDTKVQPTPKGATLYSIGQPTDEEQLYLEYLNRMRANPTAEGVLLANTTDPDVLSAYSYFSVDLNLMKSEFATNPAVPPLAMNAQLTTAARLHSGDMFTNVFQGHNGTDGSTLGQRATAAGYSWSSLGENVYSYSVSVFYGHAGFAVDWGPGTGGMQTPPGHRNNMFSAGFREVGVGVVDGNNSSGAASVGPQLVTQDFGTASSPRPFITGVVYYDLNGNGSYDVGEGIGGVKVDSTGSAYYAMTADSGGYALPVSSNGTYVVTFSGSGGLTNRVSATITSLKNVKVDFIPAYTAPVISGPNPAVLNQNNSYSFTGVGGATSYDWQRTQLAPYTAVEGAESGTANVTIVSSAYSVIQTAVVGAGSHSFQLAHPDTSDQSVTLNAALRPGASSQLTFLKRLGYSGNGETAHVQISTDSGATWQDIWTQTGTSSSGEASFSTVTLSLASYANQTINVRFAYTFSSGSYYPSSNPGVGFYFDNIAVSNATQATSPVITSIPSGTNFIFMPTNNSSYLLQVRAHINSKTLPWNSGTLVNVAAAAPSVTIASTPVLSAGQLQLTFNVANFASGMTFQLWKASDPSGSWAQDTSATLQTLVAGSQYKFTTPTGSATKSFYRVRASY